LGRDLLKQITEERRYAEITGFKNVKVNDPDLLLRTQRGDLEVDVAVQFFNANLIATWEHLYFAVIDALLAFRTKRNISKSVAVEVMLYASAQRQIKKAIELVGVQPGCSDLATVVVGKSREGVESAISSISKHLRREPDDRVLDLSPEKTREIRTAFEITENELAVVTKDNNLERALVDLILERMALLSTRL
jgi:tRNA threonylcarbamoyladenosine modification (KEOPS) complex Cgi121 subunit